MNIEWLYVSHKEIRKLKKNGFTTVESLAFTPDYFLVEALGLSYREVSKFKEKLLKKIDVNVLSAYEHFLKKRSQVKYITTGCGCLDGLLGGGVETGAVTEFVGEFGTGKTQLAHQLAVTVQLPEDKGGLEAKAVYIDTEGTFRPERIIQIAQHQGLNPLHTLENILYTRTYTTEQQIFTIKLLEKLLEEINIGLVVVDSIIAHFRAEYSGSEVFIRQRLLARHLKDLNLLAEKYNIAVVITNHVLAVPGVFVGNPLKPVGGNVLAHGCTHRVWLRKIDEKRWAARLFDSPLNPEAEVVYAISKEGVLDYRSR